MSQKTDFVEIVASLEFYATPAAVCWYANNIDEPYHELIFSVSRFTSRRADGYGEDKHTASGFAVYESNWLYNLPLTTLRVVDMAKFDSEQEKLARTQGVPFVRAPDIGNEIGRAEISEWEKSIYCLIGLNHSLFQKLLDEIKSNRPATIKIFGLCKERAAHSVQNDFSKVLLIDSESTILVHLDSLMVEQKIDN